METSFTPKRIHKKILVCIDELANMGVEADDEGIYLVIVGKGSAYAAAKAFGCMTSLRNRAFKAALRILHRYEYVRRSYDEGLDSYFYILTQSGRDVAMEFAPKMHKRPLKETPGPRHYRARKETE